MSLVIDMIDETETLSSEDMEVIESLIKFAASHENVEPESELSITFVNNEKIQELNHLYRQKDRPTDVISFAMQEMGEDELEIIGLNMPIILGDIIISVPKAVEQAEEYGHSFLRELGFLALHGFLHLLGYDHMTETDEKLMFNKQKEILTGYGLKRF